MSNHQSKFLFNLYLTMLQKCNAGDTGNIEGLQNQFCLLYNKCDYATQGEYHEMVSNHNKGLIE